MPKRTKKEKLLAEYRRKLQPVDPIDEHLDTRPVLSYTLEPKVAISDKTVSTTILPADELGVIKQDLQKTLFLAASTVLIELLLYWRIGG